VRSLRTGEEVVDPGGRRLGAVALPDYLGSV